MRPSLVYCCLAAGLFVFAIPQYARADLMQDAVHDYQFQDFADAEKKFTRVIAKNPGNVTAHYYLGLTLQQNGKPKEAVTHLELVKEAAKTTPIEGIDDALASAYIAADMPEKALPVFRQKYEKNPQDDTVAFDYAKALQASGQFTDARSIYRRLIEKKSPQADSSCIQMTQIFISSKAYATAMEQLNQIDKESPYDETAQAYREALAPAVNPISLYISSEAFYNDNASSGSSILGSVGGIVGSNGLTQIIAVNSRAFEPTEKIRAKLGYLYYGVFHSNPLAKENDFVGHFINPSLGFQATPNIYLELKGDIQFYYFAHQKLSRNFGSTASVTWTGDNDDSLALSGSFISKKYTTHFLSGGVSTSLADLDARSFGIGLSGTLVDKSGDGSITLDYAFTMDRPTHTGDPALGPKSRDAETNEHALSTSVTIPFTGRLSKFSLQGDAGYSYRDFLNLQTGSKYGGFDGRFITNITASYGVKLLVTDIVKVFGHGISISTGFDHTRSRSQTGDLTYESNRYTGEISGSL